MVTTSNEARAFASCSGFSVSNRSCTNKKNKGDSQKNVLRLVCSLVIFICHDHWLSKREGIAHCGRRQLEASYWPATVGWVVAVALPAAVKLNDF